MAGNMPQSTMSIPDTHKIGTGILPPNPSVNNTGRGPVSQDEQMRMRMMQQLMQSQNTQLNPAQLMMAMMPGGALDTSQSGKNLADTRMNMESNFAKPTGMAPA